MAINFDFPIHHLGKELNMLSIKDSAKKIIDDLPDDISYDELINELLFKRMIERGIHDSQKNKITPDEDMEKEIEKW